MKSNSIEYPLTDKAKETARLLVKAWDEEKIEQEFSIIDSSSAEGRSTMKGLGAFNYPHKAPSIAVLKELASYGLIQSTILHNRIDAILLQELRNAVTRDFALTDFFLVTHGSGIQISHQLEQLLATEIQQYEGLRRSIEALKIDEKPTKSKIAKVIEELGRSLGHGANTVNVVQGIGILSSLLA
jgi:hypothetical protein